MSTMTTIDKKLRLSHDNLLHSFYKNLQKTEVTLSHITEDLLDFSLAFDHIDELIINHPCTLNYTYHATHH